MTSSPEPRRPSFRTRLRLEPLEDRAVPTMFAVTTTLDVVNSTDGKVSLREAISRANSHPGPDAILLPAGLFRIVVGGTNENDNGAGDFDVRDSLTIQGAGPGLTVVDGQYKDRLFDLLGPVHVQFAGLTLRHGGGDVNGGAVQALSANIGLANCVVTDNRALAGGGINAETGNVTVTGSTVRRNVARDDGGGIRLGSGTVTVTASTIRSNLAQGDGGGFFAQTATLIGTNLSGNIAVDGGGFFAQTATLTNCILSGNSASLNGGGLDVVDTGELTNCTLSRNFAAQNGGGLSAQGSVTLTGTSIHGNRAGGSGAGLDVGLSATLTKSAVLSNAAGGVGGGGGVRASILTLTGSTVSDNFAGFSGGGVIADSVNATNSTVSGNSAAGSGGGIEAHEAGVFNSTVSGNSARAEGGGIHAAGATVTNSTVSGNTAASAGGGLTADTALVTNSTVCRNSTTGSGGGILVRGSGVIVNSTIVRNTALSDGGGLFRQASAASAVHVQNTIIARNLAGSPNFSSDAAGTFTSGGHNLIGDGTGSTGFANGVNGDLVGTSFVPIDPLLGPLGNNGGRTQTIALLAGSPAIDRGDNSNAPTTDQRGLPRRKDGNGDGIAVVDIGAFER